jgi:hypothetical protein
MYKYKNSVTVAVSTAIPFLRLVGFLAAATSYTTDNSNSEYPKPPFLIE